LTSVLHLITTIKRGGAENQLLVLVKEQVRSGLKVHVAYLKNEPELVQDFQKAGAIVHNELIGLKPFKQPFALRKLLHREISILHAHLPRAELVGLFCPAKFTFITSRHNAEPFFPGSPKFISNVLARLVCYRAKTVIAISLAVKDFLLEQGEIKDEKQAQVVLYGYVSNYKSPRVTRSSSATINNVGTISRLTDQKDIPTMLSAFKEYLASVPTARLFILGEGPLEMQIKAMCSRMFADNVVTFLGRSAKIYEFLGKLDAFVLTSKYEGFGMVLLEAMDAGVPIVASRNSAIPEVLGANFPGLCETGNSSDFKRKIELLNDVAYQQRILNQQRERLAIFDSRIMERKIRSIYFER